MPFTSVQPCEEACEDEASDPGPGGADNRDVEGKGLVEPFREAEQHERRERAAELERGDAVDLPREDADEPERHEAEHQRERGDHEHVHAGSSDARRVTRSCTSTVPSARSTSIT